MKKFLASLLEKLVPSIASLIGDTFANIFRKIKPVDKLTTVLQELYIIVVRELQPIAETTETDKDDLAIQELKKAIEKVANENGITLIK